MKEIIQPTLDKMGWSGSPIAINSRAAAQLLLGTALVESRLVFLRQLQGPALGFYQMEPRTYKDICRWLDTKIGLKEILQTTNYCEILPPVEALQWNLRLATQFARLHYFRVQERLPDYDDIWAQAAYWKKHYNTSRGKGTVEKYLTIWDRYVGKSKENR